MHSTRPTLVFDGDCGFCTSSARLLRRVLPASIAIEPWQMLDLQAYGLTPEQCTAEVQWAPVGGTPRGGAPAIAGALKAGGPAVAWLGWLLDVWPVRWLAARVYAWVARNRYRLPGGTPACATGQPWNGSGSPTD